MKTRFIISATLNALIVSFIANCLVLVKCNIIFLWFLLPAFIVISFFTGVSIPNMRNPRLAICQYGTVLLCAFYFSIVASTVYQIILAFQTIPHDYITFLWSLAVCVAVHVIVFWVGIICVYLTSTQLGAKWRIAGLICGLIPIVNLVVLFCIIKITTNEYLFEAEKYLINEQRKTERICATKYPILLVHGVFFRDTKFFNYWGRIPKELEINGATIFYGEHSSAASIVHSAAELKVRITQILAATGAEKINIIAHSKGGLDCRYAIAKLGIDDCVASLTTINTPHRGCLFADYLLTKISDDIKQSVANTYNATLKKFGEADPDFLAAVNDLTASYCNELDAQMPTPEGVYCQSVGSVLIKAGNGSFPLNFSYHLVKHFSGDNDGLVDEKSFCWGENYILLKPTENRGISHGDMIDLNRENINGLDVREFYVNLVADLKNKGL